MNSKQSFSRMLLAATIGVAALTTAGPASAQVAPQAVTVPNSLTVAYNLAPGAVSAPITLPASVPVQIMGTQLAVGFRGVGQVTVLRVPVAPLFLEWVGLDSTAGAAITQGFSSTPGTKIVFLDFSHLVRIEVASASAIRVHNLSTGQRNGFVNLSW